MHSLATNQSGFFGVNKVYNCLMGAVAVRNLPVMVFLVVVRWGPRTSIVCTTSTEIPNGLEHPERHL